MHLATLANKPEPTPIAPPLWVGTYSSPSIQINEAMRPHRGERR